VETLRAIVTRRATAEFEKDGRITESATSDLLRAAMSAPSVENKKPWHFILIRKRKAVEELALLLREHESLLSASLCAVVCADNTEQRHMGRWAIDCAAATENLLVAAHDKGLGTHWVRVFPSKARMRESADLLKLPHHVSVFAAVFLGKPLRSPNKRASPLVEKKIHLETW